jgi:ATP phosphoribosyltransferase regulatory subunit
LQIPQGTEGIYLEEAYRHRRIVRTIEELFTGWGYLPAQVPIFDFFDTYRELLGEQGADTIYRLVDRDGDLLMLRSDITLFLAKQVGLALQAQDLPLRICYADSILRHQDREDISRNEFFQVGAELIGRDGIRGDIEIIALLSEVLTLLDLPNAYIHLGSRKLLSLMTVGQEASAVKQMAAMIEERDSDELGAAFGDGPLRDHAGILTDLFFFIGEPEGLDAMADRLPDAGAVFVEIKSELRYLTKISSIVEKVYPQTSLRIDLSEIGTQEYYTGVVFQAYAEGADRAIASGGRYDELLGHFGSACASVGFSLFLRKIESLVGRAERFDVPEASFILDDDLREALRTAKDVRSEGGIAIL